MNAISRPVHAPQILVRCPPGSGIGTPRPPGRSFGWGRSLGRGRWGTGLAMLLTGLVLVGNGCSTPKSTALAAEDRKPYTAIGIQPGDVVHMTFPGAATMNSTQQVQSDGAVALPLGGSLVVRDKTATDLEAELLKMYGPQLVVKKVTVTVESNGFPIFVWGAVGKPGRVQCRQSITVLEAIAEAGGALPGRADLRRVKVVRQKDAGTTRTYVLNVKSALSGEEGEQFYLRPSDVVYVPERFSLY